METCKVWLLNSKEEVQYGLNWGQRENRDPNQAYLQLEPEVYNSDFFPVKGKYFIVVTDDAETIIFNRAQKDKGCALQTPENNAILGRYLRKRLGVELGSEIVKEDIVNYGKDFIMFIKIDDIHDKLDFSNGTYQQETVILNQCHQQIFYGAPGTGKSHKIKVLLEGVSNENIFRTTFHPDSDYSTFVGAYKPTMKPVADKYKAVVGKDEEISYSFVPQTFIKAYVQAYRKPEEKVYLIIEEINRGNCAQIFGDLFQLLDRDATGKSEYSIKADADVRTYLEAALGKENEGIKGGELCLPSNLYIWATMNTSDQSLFPIDSAFKRRWDWEYEPIKYKNTDWKIVIDGTEYSWVSFQRKVNEKIVAATNSEDKMLGDYFVNPSDGVITDKVLLNKILFYLWNDVCKDGEGDIFKAGETEEVSFSELYGENGNTTLKRMMSYLGVTDIDGNKVTTENNDENTGL